MHFGVLTLFPEQVTEFLNQSIIGRAINNGIISVDTLDIRKFAVNKYGKLDDTLYGGGTGMLMQCQPVMDAYEKMISGFENKPYTVYVSPKGRVFNQSVAKEFAAKDGLVIICGHYEGIDSRVIDSIVDEEISIGDYVLTGGEVASCVIIDSVSRMIDGVLPDSSAYTNESHMGGTLECPQYTKPEIWNDCQVPEVLLSGNKALIDEFNETMSLKETLIKRPDMLDKLQLSEKQWENVIKSL